MKESLNKFKENNVKASDYATDCCPTCLGSGHAYTSSVFGYLRWLRKEKGWKQKEAAKAAGLSNHTLNRFEQGDQKLSYRSIKVLTRIYMNTVPEKKIGAKKE